MKIVSVVDHSHAVDTVALDYDQRSRRRAVFRTDSGEEVLLDLKAAATLRDGQGLRLDDGREVRVVARPEPLLAISCVDGLHLSRIAWHFGNRHLPTQITVFAGGGGELRIRPDHVMEELAVKLGATCRPVEAPFDPEKGAYASASGGHAHAH